MAKQPGRRGLFERLMFSIMGPPDVGDVNAPVAVPLGGVADLCHRCGQPWTAHERVTSGSSSYRRCPEQAQ